MSDRRQRSLIFGAFGTFLFFVPFILAGVPFPMIASGVGLAVISAGIFLLTYSADKE